MGPIYDSGLLCWPKGGTVTIHPALTAAKAATLARELNPFSFYGLDQGALGDEPGGEVAPQRHDQFAREGDDRDASDPFAGIVRPRAWEPVRERAVRLVPQPEPGHLNRFSGGAGVARLADPLFAVDPPAAPWTGREPEIARDLAPIAEVLVQDLI